MNTLIIYRKDGTTRVMKLITDPSSPYRFQGDFTKLAADIEGANYNGCDIR